MEEPPGGANHGHRAGSARHDFQGETGKWLPLAARELRTREFLRDGGWTIVHPAHDDAGTHSHFLNQHTVLHPDDYVDMDAVVAALEEALGFTVGQLHSVYRTGGRIPSDRRELRARIDARLLALLRSGANMNLFGRLADLDGRTVERALARARAEENA